MIIRPEALADLDDIANDSLDRAIEFIHKLNQQIEKLADNPGMGR
jgi:plasmid stabilization system protein ParE